MNFLSFLPSFLRRNRQEEVESENQNESNENALDGADIAPYLDRIADLSSKIESEAKAFKPVTKGAVADFLDKIAAMAVPIYLECMSRLEKLVSEAILGVEAAQTSFNRTLAECKTTLAEARTTLEEAFTSFYHIEVETEHARDRELKNLPKRVRMIKIAMFGTPDIEIGSAPGLFVVLIRFAGALLASFTVTYGLEVWLNLPVFQNRTNQLESIGISLGIAFVGNTLAFSASRLSRLWRNYRDACIARNHYFDIHVEEGDDPTQIKPERVDPETGKFPHVDPPSADRRWLSLLAHGVWVVFMVGVVIARLLALEAQHPEYPLGDVVANSLGTWTMIAIWLTLYVWERMTHPLEHKRLGEYYKLVERRGLLEEARKSSADNPEIEAAIDTYRATAEKVGKRIGNGKRTFAKSKERLSKLVEALQNAPALFDEKFLALAGNSLAFLVDLHNTPEQELHRQEEYGLNSPERKNAVQASFTSKCPPLNQLLLERAGTALTHKLVTGEELLILEPAGIAELRERVEAAAKTALEAQLQEEAAKLAAEQARADELAEYHRSIRAATRHQDRRSKQ